MEQYDSVWDIGTLVDQYFEEGIVVNIYAINEFFVEVYYDKNTKTIFYKKSFKHGELLDKFLDKNKI